MRSAIYRSDNVHISGNGVEIHKKIQETQEQKAHEQYIIQML